MEIYLDNCATTRVCDEAAAACLRVMTEDYGNPSSLHKKGMEAENILTSARRQIGKMLGCDGDCVYFTGSATESNNLAILGAAAANPRGGKTIVTTTVEHPSVAKTVEYLEEQGYTVRRIAPKPDGNFDPQDFLDAVDGDTLLLTFMMVNNEMGTVLPYQAVIPALKKKYPRLLIHMDAVQGFAKFPLSVKRLDIDLLTFSGHKLYAPKGIGVLYVKKGVRLKPVIHGGGQEKGLRSGTHAVQLAAGLQEALALCDRNRAAFQAHYAALNQRLREGVAKLEDVLVNSPENGAPHLLNLSVMGVPSEIMLHFLETKGIYVSSGSACAKGAKSSVLAAYGLPDERIKSALRVSFSKDSTPEDIDTLLEALAEGIAKYRRIASL
ncbi:MAG TPA: cysteine desulfurase [Candidatus Merdivicinus intestinigallinarum]|nr:cysteine desulfurase [Candidatus Merdivicinus intestinigallinarum]